MKTLHLKTTSNSIRIRRAKLYEDMKTNENDDATEAIRHTNNHQRISDLPDMIQDTRKCHRRSSVLGLQKKRRRLLPFTPTEDDSWRLARMRSLAYALTASKIEFSNELTYMSIMAPRSANQAEYENGGMQGVLLREDFEILEQCKAMCKRGERPPLLVVFDSCEGVTVEVDGLIKDMTLVAEYTQEKQKKQNLKCVRYNIDGECRVFLVAMRDISKGRRLYYDYNGYEHEYPTHHIV